MRLLCLLLTLVFVGARFGAAQPAAWHEESFTSKTLGEWVALTKDKDKNVRQAAAHALGDEYSEGKTVVPVLTELLRDKEPGVRQAAAWSLGSKWRNAATHRPCPHALTQRRERASSARQP